MARGQDPDTIVVDINTLLLAPPFYSISRAVSPPITHTRPRFGNARAPPALGMLVLRLLLAVAYICAMASGSNGGHGGGGRRATSGRGTNRGVVAGGRTLSGRGRGMRASQARGGGRSFFAAATPVSDLPNIGLLALGPSARRTAQPQQSQHTRTTLRAERIDRMTTQRQATDARLRERVQQAANAR